ncbi:DNA/RNA non-specific endonuclease [Pedobacter metabolipauper]|uniref:DNA/RNA non-specific endonuclease n=1 Tax=Pedobacter metabolipauper TaxID=425513 RepID=A0A4R6SZ90_9SPHI|nr:DNA/RNA non-specific endonuclease [Pedobacter metabolipauper]TDQ11382.1 DNA/RNA non-specific endonuclease [Pedobacter metabolipauper]
MKLKTIFYSLVLTLYCLAVSAQQVDKVIQTSIYKSYYSYKVKNPLYVTYLLKKGGGDCDRSAFSFRKCDEQTASDDDYSGTGYDKGHLANAEDFAYDCILDKETFCYYNCFPQTVKLNRGIWKKWETKLRALSQTKSIFIIAGGIYTDKLLKPGHTVVIPDYCYKIVVDPATQAIMYCLLFPNDDSGHVEDLTLAQLKAKLVYPLVP